MASLTTDMTEVFEILDDQEDILQSSMNEELDKQVELDMEEITSIINGKDPVLSRIEAQVTRIDEEEDIYQSMNAELDKQIAQDMEAIKKYLNKTESESINKRMEFFDKMSDCQIGNQIDASVSNHILYQHTALGTVKWHECNHCDFKTKNRTKLREHTLERHTEGSWLKCTKCSFKTKKHIDQKRHESLAHPEDGNFKCRECSASYKNSAEMTQHLRENHDMAEVKCEKCSFVAADRSDLREHILATHVTLNVSWYKCARCAYRTVRKTNLDRHIAYKHSGVF